MDVLGLMLRDVREAPLLAVWLLLPTLVAGVALRRGARAALLAPAILVAQVALWVLSSATDWWSNPGLGRALEFAVVPPLVGLVIVAVAWWRARSVAPIGG